MRIVGRAYRELTLDKAAKLGYLIGRIAGEKNLVISGRDSFRVSRMLKRAISAGVMSAGADVMDFHESLTGEIGYAIKRFGAKMGYMVSLHPPSRGVLIRIYAAPGHELLGENLESILKYIEADIQEPGEIGWVYYAEYMHRLYTTSIVSFIQGDLVSAKKPSIVMAPDYAPLDTVFAEIARALKLNQVIIGEISTPTYPSLDLLWRVWRVKNALGSDIGVVMSHDGSTITVCIDKTGFLTPEELLVVLLEKYSPGKVAVLNPVSSVLVKHLEESNYDVSILDKEEEFISNVKKRRPLIGATWRGEFITPIFSLSYDAVLTYVQILEVLAELGIEKLVERVVAFREKLVYEVIDISTGLEVCREKGIETTLWGCRILEDNRVTTLIYNPEVNGFVKITSYTATPEHSK